MGSWIIILVFALPHSVNGHETAWFSKACEDEKCVENVVDQGVALGASYAKVTKPDGEEVVFYLQ
jgi:hypothetical protein